MTDPAQLMQAIDADCMALDQAAGELAKLNDDLVEAELAYLDAMDGALADLEEEYRDRDERLPSERQREAHAHKRIDSELRGRFLRLKRQKQQWTDWGSLHEKALSGRQSQLSFLKAEGQAPQAQGSGLAFHRSAA